MGKSIVNSKLNLLKAFACMAVVFIHITFPGKFGQIVMCAAASAVPIFFMIAGYYAYGKNAEVIKRRLFKILKIFIYAYALFFTYGVIWAIKGHELAAWFSEHFNWQTPIMYIAFCTIYFANPLWYLIAMLEVYIVWFIVVKVGKERIVSKIFPILFVLQIALTMYCKTQGLAWYMDVNFITQGLSWFLLGYFLHTDKAEKVREIKSYWLVLIAIAGCVITVLPTAFNLSVNFSVIGYIPCAFALFTLTLKNPGKSICKPLEFIGDKLSLNIYVFHVLISGIVGFAFRRFLKINTESSTYCGLHPIIVLILTIFVSWIVYICVNQVKKSVKKPIKTN